MDLQHRVPRETTGRLQFKDSGFFLIPAEPVSDLTGEERVLTALGYFHCTFVSCLSGQTDERMAKALRD